MCRIASITRMASAVFLAAPFLSVPAAQAVDQECTLKFLKPPTKEGKVTVKVQQKDQYGHWGTIYLRDDIDIPSPCSVTDKRDIIRDKLKEVFKDYVSDVGDNGVKITSKTADYGIRFLFESQDTGEPQDSVEYKSGDAGTLSFQNTFDPYDVHQQPAIFTAGIVTDVGELVVRVSSQELNFQTQGPIICQALFQRLAPQAPQYGAQLNYAGDRLEIYFDPAYTVQRGGVVFGTTSPTPGCWGEAQAPSTLVPGDLNCDGNTDFGDINPFVLALTNPAGYQAAFPNCNILNGDINQDGRVDFGDINPFVALLTQAGQEGNRPSAPAAEAPPAGG